MVAPSHLKSLQALELAVRTGSLAAAADVLGISPAAVGQRVKALEDYLGTELLVRGRSGIQAAPALIPALPHLNNAFSELSVATNALELRRGCELHIAAPPDFVELWLEERLGSFRKKHPHIEFCINGRGDVPLRLGKVDCEIRFGPPGLELTQSDVLFHDLVAPVCSLATFKRTATVPARRRLEDFPLLHLDFYKDDPAGIAWPEWVATNHLTRTAPARGIRFQRLKPALDAVLADAGFTLCGVALTRTLLENGTIRLAYPSKLGIWTEWAFIACFRADLHKRTPAKVFREWLLQESRATSEWLRLRAGQKYVDTPSPKRDCG